jgi:hypothetical protein
MDVTVTPIIKHTTTEAWEKAHEKVPDLRLSALPLSSESCTSPANSTGVYSLAIKQVES